MVSGAHSAVSAIDGDAPTETEQYSAAESVETDETGGSSVTKTRCSASKVERPCVSMPKLGSGTAKFKILNSIYFILVFFKYFAWRYLAH